MAEKTSTINKKFRNWRHLWTNLLWAVQIMRSSRSGSAGTCCMMVMCECCVCTLHHVMNNTAQWQVGLNFMPVLHSRANPGFDQAMYLSVIVAREGFRRQTNLICNCVWSFGPTKGSAQTTPGKKLHGGSGRCNYAHVLLHGSLLIARLGIVFVFVFFHFWNRNRYVHVLVHYMGLMVSFQKSYSVVKFECHEWCLSIDLICCV